MHFYVEQKETQWITKLLLGNSMRNLITLHMSRMFKISTYGYLSCCIGVCSGPEINHSPLSFYLSNHFTVEKAK